MTVFLFIAFCVLLAGTVTMSFYAGAVPLLGVLTKVFISITVITGALFFIFAGIQVYNNFKKK